MYKVIMNKNKIQLFLLQNLCDKLFFSRITLDVTVDICNDTSIPSITSENGTKLLHTVLDRCTEDM